MSNYWTTPNVFCDGSVFDREWSGSAFDSGFYASSSGYTGYTTGETITFGSQTTYPLYSIFKSSGHGNTLEPSLEDDTNTKINGFLFTKNGDILIDYSLSKQANEIDIGVVCSDVNHYIKIPSNVIDLTGGNRPFAMSVMFKGWIKLRGTSSLQEFYPVFVEQDIPVGVYVWSNIEGIPQSVEPLQPVEFDFSATVTEKYRQCSSLGISDLDGNNSFTVSEHIVHSAYSNPGRPTVGDVVVPNHSLDNYWYTISITVSNWASIVCSIEQYKDNYKIYVGVPVGNDFLGAFRVNRVKTSNYGSVTDTPKVALELNKMSKTILDYDDEGFSFDYDISDIAGSGQSLSVSVVNTQSFAPLHYLASGNSKFANFQTKTVYHSGDYVQALDFTNAGSLTFDDGATVSMADVTITSGSTVCSFVDGTLEDHAPIEVDIGTPSSFTMTYTMTLEHFGTLTIENEQCTTDLEVQLGEIVLSGEKKSFNPSEIIGFGNDAVLIAYDVNGNVYDSVDISTIGSRITNKDPRYGQPAKNYLQDGKVTLHFTWYGREISHEICFNYDNPNYKGTGLYLDVSSVKRRYYLDPEDNDFSFDYSGLVVKKEHHSNVFDGDEVVTTVREETVSSPTITVNKAIGSEQDDTYTITVSKMSNYVLELKGTFNIDVEILRISSIIVSQLGETKDSITYWDNGVDVFKKPDDEEFSFTAYYNDPTKEPVVISADDLIYYRDANRVNPIAVGASITKNNVAKVDNNYCIYFYSEDYNFGYFYNIVFKADGISSVTLANNINVFYGNSLNNARTLSQVTLNLVYQSGVTGSISNSAFRFSFDNIITTQNKPTGKLKMLINNVEYEVNDTDDTQTGCKVIWHFPYPKLVINDGNFQTRYNNTVDAINLEKLTATVEYYEDALFATKCEYEVECTYSSASTEAYNKFVVIGNGQLEYVQGVYDINAGNTLNVNMNGGSEITPNFTVKVKNEFYDSEDSTNKPQYVQANETIHIFEIINIKGIKLMNVKTTYSVGDGFLVNDGTMVKVFYEDNNGNDRTLDCPLGSGLTALNIYPTPGTVFKTVATGKIVTVSSATNYNVSVQYSIDVKPKYMYDDTKTHQLVAIWLDNHECPDGVRRSKHFLVNRTRIVNGSEEETTQISNNGRVLATNVSESMLEVYGYLDNVNDESKNAKVVLFEDYVPEQDGANNIEVKFPCYVKGNADLINKCHFGIMFGNNNAKNRLFVSGNPEYRNKDWHTGQVDSTQTKYEEMVNGNYGYFEDLSECTYGETDNAVVGYDIVSTDKLLVLKNHSDKETTIYFRQPQLVTAINSSGTSVTGLNDETLYQEEFSLSKGNNSVAGVNPFAVVNFNGDTLFISEDNEVVGLDLTGIIGDNQRYANSRSHYIDADLKQYDLSKAFIWTNNKYLFVVLSNKVYVAHYQLKSEQQYEWFVIDVPDVTTVFELNGVIYYGTSKGELFKFTEIYKDARKVFIGYGATRLEINDETEIITASSYLAPLDSSKKYYFRPIPEEDVDTSYIYYSLGTINNVNSIYTDFYVKNGNSNEQDVIELVCSDSQTIDLERRELLLKRIAEGNPIYFNGINSASDVEYVDISMLNGLKGKPYFLKEVDSLDVLHHYYQVYDVNNQLVPIRYLQRARLCLRVTKDMEMTDIDAENGTFKLTADGEILNVVQYNGQDLNAFKGEVIEYSNVEAFFIARPETMGSLENFKTVWSFTVTNDTNYASELEMCHATNKIPQENMKSLCVSKDKLGFDFHDFDFSRLDFDKNIVPRTYTYKRVLSNVKFVCFAFRNYNDTNSILGSMVVTYTLPYPSYGGD